MDAVGLRSTLHDHRLGGTGVDPEGEAAPILIELEVAAVLRRGRAAVSDGPELIAVFDDGAQSGGPLPGAGIGVGSRDLIVGIGIGAAEAHLQRDVRVHIPVEADGEGHLLVGDH